MKIYTKTGDEGETGLFAGPRVSKDHPRIEAYGAVDELNCVIGVVRAEKLPSGIDALLHCIQNDLFAIGAELATPDPQASDTDYLADQHIEALEAAIDQYESTLEPLKQFILPGGTQAAATLHFARATCRRAERQIVTLSQSPNEQVSQRVLRYVNRLSDLLFVLGRAVNAESGQSDVIWQKPAMP